MIFHCPFCGVGVKPHDASCPSCRRGMLRSCPHCGEKIAVNAAMCKYCAEELETPSKETPPSTPDIVFLEETGTEKAGRPPGILKGVFTDFVVLLLTGLVPMFAFAMAAHSSRIEMPIATMAWIGFALTVLAAPVLMPIRYFRFRREKSSRLRAAVGAFVGGGLIFVFIAATALLTGAFMVNGCFHGCR